MKINIELDPIRFHAIRAALEAHAQTVQDAINDMTAQGLVQQQRMQAEAAKQAEEESDGAEGDSASD